MLVGEKENFPDDPGEEKENGQRSAAGDKSQPVRGEGTARGGVGGGVGEGERVVFFVRRFFVRVAVVTARLTGGRCGIYCNEFREKEEKEEAEEEDKRRASIRCEDEESKGNTERKNRFRIAHRSALRPEKW
ncbi:hypothetical protein ZHAS_00004433 [Anopheles sinensis]|uniref:Uncharacterized protein n=1 Tax=Anopheles sinensis TaxID=74873 RepID=A0A084VGX6_ANOSI|nr:hypothetical protein ZHAS_00004433 [Anopheles sinensis]